MKKLILYLIAQTLVFVSMAQTQPLVVLDGFFIKRDKSTTLENVGIENIKDTTYILPDSAMKLMNEYGKNGLFVINTYIEESERFMNIPQDLYFGNPPLLLIDYVESNMKDLNQINPADIISIRVRTPLEMVKIKGMDMVRGIIIVKTIKYIPLEPSLAVDSTFTISEEKVKLPTFQIELKLSEKAEKKLKTSKETIIVVAYFVGIPFDKNSKDYDVYHGYSVGEYSIELKSEKIATFDSVYISRKRFEALEDKNFEVIVNVYSGRKSSRYNLLDVELLQEPINEIKGKRHFLRARLIEEM